SYFARRPGRRKGNASQGVDAVFGDSADFDGRLVAKRNEAANADRNRSRKTDGGGETGERRIGESGSRQPRETTGLRIRLDSGRLPTNPDTGDRVAGAAASTRQICRYRDRR